MEINPPKEKPFDVAYCVWKVRYVRFDPRGYERFRRFVESVNKKLRYERYKLDPPVELNGSALVVLRGGPLWGDWQTVHEGDCVVDEGDGNLLAMSDEVFRKRYVLKRPVMDAGEKKKEKDNVK